MNTARSGFLLFALCSANIATAQSGPIYAELRVFGEARLTSGAKDSFDTPWSGHFSEHHLQGTAQVSNGPGHAQSNAFGEIRNGQVYAEIFQKSGIQNFNGGNSSGGVRLKSLYEVVMTGPPSRSILTNYRFNNYGNMRQNRSDCYSSTVIDAWLRGPWGTFYKMGRLGNGPSDFSVFGNHWSPYFWVSTNSQGKAYVNIETEINLVANTPVCGPQSEPQVWQQDAFFVQAPGHRQSDRNGNSVFEFSEDGWSADCPSLRIVDNQFVGTPIPEPSSVLAMAAGLGALLTIRRRRS